MDLDPTRIDLTIDGGGVDPRTDPFANRIAGVAHRHGMTEFDAPWISHIVGNLYQGGCTNGLVLPERFTTVVSLYQSERYTVYHEGVYRHVVKMLDDHDEPDADEVRRLAQIVVDACRKGPTLVHCQAGLNRSSLISAAALVLDGYAPAEAIALLRERRSPACLCNTTFERFVLNFTP